jgi:integrase/recombinase XerD
MNLSTALDGFLLSMATSGRSQNTISLYKVYLQRLIEFLGDPEIKTITEKDIQNFYAYMQTGYQPRRMNKHNQAPLSRSSINRIWVSVRSFYTWAEKDLDIMRMDNKIGPISDPSSEIYPLSNAEIKSLLDACDKTLCKGSRHQKEHYQRRPTRLRDQAIILLLLDTGLRVSEMCRLTIGDVDLSTGEVHIIKWGSGRKTKSRAVYIGDRAKRAAWLYLAKRGQLQSHEPFFENINGSFMDRNGVRCLLEDLSKKAGIQRANPHKFRHTFAIQYLRNGGDVFTLQRLLGHSSLDMVRRYLAIAEVDSAAVHRRASPVDNWKL